MKYLRFAFLVLVMCLITVGGARQARVYAGYCPAVGRALTDQERFRAAVEYKLPMFRHVATAEVSAYANVDAFLKAFPDCCSMVKQGSEGWTPGWYDRVTGITYGIVAIKYEAIASDKRLQQDGPSTSFVPIGVCGKAHSSLY